MFDPSTTNWITPRPSRRATASASQSPRKIAQSSTSAAAKTSTASNSSGAKDRRRNSSRSCSWRSARSAPRSCQPSSVRTNTPLSRPALSKPRNNSGLPAARWCNSLISRVSTAPPSTARASSPVCSRVNASTRRLSNSRSFHSAVTASGALSPDRIVTTTRALAAGGKLVHQRRRQRIEPLRIVDDDDQVLVLLQGAMRGGQHRGGFSWSVHSQGPIERTQRHRGAGLGAQHIPHRQPARPGSRGQRASQRRFTDPAITDQRDTLKLRVVLECRQRLTDLVIAAHQRPTRPALCSHMSTPSTHGREQREFYPARAVFRSAVPATVQPSRRPTPACCRR